MLDEIAIFQRLKKGRINDRGLAMAVLNHCIDSLFLLSFRIFFRFRFFQLSGINIIDLFINVILAKSVQIFVQKLVVTSESANFHNRYQKCNDQENDKSSDCN
jgi:hypothetical protein